MKPNKVYIFFSVAAFFLFLFLPAPQKNQQEAEKPKTGRPAPQIEAQSALAEDMLTGEVLFSKNSGEILPLASITKIITLLTVLDYVSLDEEVIVSKASVLTPEPSSLRVGEHFKVSDLLAMVMTESSNDAIFALFEHVGLAEENFLNLMRNKAESMGANSMSFSNITGLDVSETVSGGYGSAENLIKIVTASLDSPIWQYGSVREVISREGIHHKLKATNELGPELTPLLGSKTGYTDLAGGNLLVIVEYPIGRPLGIVALGSSEQGRFSDVKKILEWVKSR